MLIICVSPGVWDKERTLSNLKFGKKAKLNKQKPCLQETVWGDNEALQKEVERLKSELHSRVNR